MKICPVCEEQFAAFDDVVEIKNEIYHESCIEIYPIKFCAYRDNDYEDGFLGDFEEDSKKMAFEILNEGEFLEEKTYLVTYKDLMGELHQIETKAATEERARKNFVPLWTILKCEEKRDS